MCVSKLGVVRGTLLAANEGGTTRWWCGGGGDVVRGEGQVE